MLCPQLVGRATESATLAGALATARAGHGGGVFVVGEAGMGKSRLAREIITAAAPDTRVLVGRCVPGAVLPYRAVTEALASAARRGAACLNQPELGPFRSVLATLVPDWRPLDGSLPAAPESPVVLAEAVLRVLRVLAGEGGCLLVVEDLHWADPETLAVVEYVVDNAVGERLLCIGTARTEPSPGLTLVRAMARRRAAQLVELRPLSAVDATRMAALCLGTLSVPPEREKVVAAAEGVPFLVEELLACAGSGVVVPPSFADTVQDRLAVLAPSARQTLEVAAVLGPVFETDLLEVITGLAAADVHDGLRAGVAAQLVVAAKSGFRFRHALTRDAVMDGLLPPQQAALAAAALEGVQAAYPQLPGEWCERAADLAAAAGQRQLAAELLVQAGRRALVSGALASAATMLHRALQLNADDTTPRIVLIEVLTLAGEVEEALAVGAEALRQGEDGAVRVRLARAAVIDCRWTTATGHLAAARAAGENGPVLDAIAAHVAIGTGEVGTAKALAMAAAVDAERDGQPEIACEAWEVVGRCARTRDPQAAMDAFRQALDVARAHKLAVWEVRALLELGIVESFEKTSPQALEQARERALAVGALLTVAHLEYARAVCHLRRAEAGLALAAVEACARLASRLRLATLLGLAHCLQAAAHGMAGNRAKAEAAIEQALTVAGGSSEVKGMVLLAAVTSPLVEDDWLTARQRLDRAAQYWRTTPGVPAAPHWGWWALLHALTGDSEAAGALTGLGVTINPANRGFLALAEAVTAGQRGDTGTADAAFARGDTELAPLSWIQALGRRLVAPAALTDGWGDPIAWLRAAEPVFSEAGHPQLATACRGLLRRAGSPLPPRRSPGAIPATLRALGITGREAEVLALLANGLSNAEIAARLYLSPRTIEKHVASLQQRTGCPNRTKLVAYAARTADIKPSHVDADACAPQ